MEARGARRNRVRAQIGGPASGAGLTREIAGKKGPEFTSTEMTPSPQLRIAEARDVGWRHLNGALRRVKDRVQEDRILLVGAGIAFFALLALFPAITALVAITGLLIDAADVTERIAPVVNLLPEGAAKIILDQVRDVATAQTDSLGLGAAIAIAVALYSASKGIGNLVQGINIAYAEEERRGFVKLNATMLGLTLFVVLMSVLVVTVLALAPAAVAIFSESSFWKTLVNSARWPVLFLMAMFTLTILYRYGPSRRNARWQWVAPGSFVACALWVAGTAAFAIYVQSFARYNETFGALGGVIILLTWLWLSAVVALIGAMIDAEIEEQMVADTTVGEARPAGKRGAVKADRIASAHPTDARHDD